MDRFTWRELRARPAFFPAASLVAGSLLGLQTARDGAVFLVEAALLGLLACCFQSRTGAHLAVLAAFFLAGAGLARWEAEPLVPPGLSGADAPIRLEGTVEDVASGPGGSKITLEVGFTPAPHPAVARFRASLTAKGAVDLEPGQRVQVAAQLKRAAPPGNPGQADGYALGLRRARLFHGGFDPRRVVVLTPPSRGQRWLTGTRRALAEAAARVAPDAESAALYLTLAAGLRAELGDAVEERFSRSGLAHVLSVSGLHVAALALLCLKLLRWAAVRAGGRGLDARRIAAPACVPLVWAYVAFTGYQPPAVRSALMATVLLLGLALWRRADALNSLSLAAIALLAWDPASPAELSTRLSFLAVLSLVILSPALREALPLPRPDPATPGRLRYRLQRLREGAVQTLCASAAVTLGSLPLVANAFHRVSLAGLVSNVVCLPLCGVLTGLAAGGAAAFVLWPAAATPLLFAGAWASKLLLACAEFFAAFPGAALPVPSLGPACTAAFYAGLLAFALGQGRVRWAGLAAPVALACAFVVPLIPRPGLSVTFLSVGHGDAIVLSSAGHHALVDGGGIPGGADPGRTVVVPFLREEGIRRLDLAVLSHPHPDHALGLATALAAVPTERLWLGAGSADGPLSAQVIAAASGAEVEQVEVGHPPFRLGEAEVEVLGPPKDRVLLEGVNDRSVVLRVRHGGVSFLLTGDLEADGEEALAAPPTTVLKAPHHGSRTSSTPDFLRRVRPRFVVFCVGLENRFHFPSEEVVARYQALGARCLRTDLQGAVRFVSNGNDVRVEPFHPEPPPR